MLVLDGKIVSQLLKTEISQKVTEFKAKYHRTPGLGVIIVGNNPASHVYVRNKEIACKNVGMNSIKWDFPEDISEDDLVKQIKKMNELKDVDAFLVQMPLPQHINTDKILDAIDPLKDADGLHPYNLGMLWVNRQIVAPCTPWGVIRILKHYEISIAGKNCVVVGRSQIVGKPMAHLLTQADGTVTIVHSRTKNISDFTRQADIVVVAAGKKHLMGKNDFKVGSVIIDVGIHGSGLSSSDQREKSKISGDVRFDELQGWVSAATPVPGGVGPMTIACLLENTLKLAENRMKIC